MLNKNNKCEYEPELTEKEVADILRVSVRTLQAWRSLGKSPEFHRYGYKGVRYKLSDVLVWIEDRANSQELGDL